MAKALPVFRSFMFELLSRVKITFETKDQVLEMLNQCNSALASGRYNLLQKVSARGVTRICFVGHIAPVGLSSECRPFSPRAPRFFALG